MLQVPIQTMPIFVRKNVQQTSPKVAEGVEVKSKLRTCVIVADVRPIHFTTSKTFD